MSEYDHPYGDAGRGVEEGDFERGSAEYEETVTRMKAMWQSRRDFAYQVDCCLRDENVEFGIFNGVSDNRRCWFYNTPARKSATTYRTTETSWTARPSNSSHPTVSYGRVTTSSATVNAVFPFSTPARLYPFVQE